MNNQTLTNIKTDSELLTLWLHNKAKSTQRVYQGVGKKFLEFVGKPLNQLTIEDLYQWEQSLHLRYKLSTIKNKVLIIKSLLSFGVSIGYLPTNLGKFFSKIKPKNELANRIIDKEDIRSLISLINSDRDRLIIQTLYYLGLRVSELVSMKKEDLNNGKITIYGKGQKTRVIVVPQWLFVTLNNIESLTGYIFESRLSKNMTTESIRLIIKKYAKELGLNSKVSPHFFRHSHASHSIENGCNLSLLQASLGHSSITTTERYLHINPSDSSSLYLA